MRKLNECVLYQLFLRPFTPEGTLAGAKKMLPHLKDVGVDIVYLCPVVYSDEDKREDYWSNRQRECGFHNPQNPYRLADYEKIDPEYGTDEDLREFVQAAHALEMYVLLDLVYLHCGPTCRLLTERPELFKRDERGNIATSFWHFPLFDLDKPETREYFKQNMIYFVEKFDVDGYRCDCGGAIPADLWRENIAALRAVKPGVIMLNEGTGNEQLEAGFDCDYGYFIPFDVEKMVLGEYWDEHEKAMKPGQMTAREFTEKLVRMAQSKPEGKLGALGVENHDIVNDAWYHRIETLIGHEAMNCALAVCLLAKGYPFLYTGEEVADTTRHSILCNRVYAPNCRVNWSNALTRAGEERMAFLRALTALRHAHPALCGGSIQALDSGADKVVSFAREAAGEELEVWISFSDTETSVPEMRTEGKILFGGKGGAGKLAPFEVRVIKAR